MATQEFESPYPWPQHLHSIYENSSITLLPPPPERLTKADITPWPLTSHTPPGVTNWYDYYDGFPQFSRLPKELQLEIFRLATLHPRVVRLGSQVPKDELFPRDEDIFFGPGFLRWDMDIRYCSSSPVPATLQVCHDSRMVALRAFPPGFGYKENGMERLDERYLWLNLELDTVKIEFGLFEAIQTKDKLRIRRLVLDCSGLRNKIVSLWGDFDRMDDLEELTFVMGKEVYHWRYVLSMLRSDLEELHEGNENWTCPVIKLVEEDTGIELSEINIGDVSAPWYRQMIANGGLESR